MSYRDRWYLARLRDQTGAELDSREFQYGRAVELGPPIHSRRWRDGTLIDASPPLQIVLDHKRSGQPLDFTFTNDNLPVACQRASGILQALASACVQLVLVQVESRLDEYVIVNVICTVDCIDHGRSQIQYYQAGNRVRPDKVGCPEMITELVIDPARVGGQHIFRPLGWEVTIVVSDVVKEAFCSAGITGVRFNQVTL